MKLLNIIAAVAPNGVIGNNNKIPWHLPEDFALFREFTKGSSVVMGRKTYESIGRPLPKRTNIVMSRQPVNIPGVVGALDLTDALAKAYEHSDTTFILGGNSIFAESLPMADFAYISHVHKNYEGDTFFPITDFSSYPIVDEREFSEFTFKKYKLR